MLDETIGNLEFETETELPITGVHTYDILANPFYAEDFSYYSPSIENRCDYIIDEDEDETNDDIQSDLVKIVLNLGYLTKEQRKKFKFNKQEFIKYKYEEK